MQVSRRGRVRIPPLAYWANQSVRIDHKAGRAFAIDLGFPDQLNAGTTVLTASGPVPKQVCVLPTGVQITSLSSFPWRGWFRYGHFSTGLSFSVPSMHGFPSGCCHIGQPRSRRVPSRSGERGYVERV